MIQSGMLLIQKGTKLPTSILTKDGSATNDWTEVESGAELLQLKAQLGDAGWNYFYLGAVKETAIGKSPKSVSLAVAVSRHRCA